MVITEEDHHLRDEEWQIEERVREIGILSPHRQPSGPRLHHPFPPHSCVFSVEFDLLRVTHVVTPPYTCSMPQCKLFISVVQKLLHNRICDGGGREREERYGAEREERMAQAAYKIRRVLHAELSGQAIIAF